MMLTLQNCQGGYGTIPVLHGVSFSIATGEAVALMGHNGMGKSTLLRLIAGLADMTQGSIAVAGNDISGEPAHRRAGAGIGYVPQGRQIFPALSVRENLIMGCAKELRSAEATIAAVLEYFPRLKPLLRRLGGALSGGEQQLLAIARCICGNPRVMLLDEPTEGIQPSIVDEIGATLRAIRKRHDMTMLIVEQRLDFVRALTGRVIVLRDGFNVFDSPMHAEIDQPLTDAMFGSTGPKQNQTMERGVSVQ